MRRLSLSWMGCCFLFLCAAWGTPSLAKDPVRDSVVKLHVTQRPPEYQRPWTKGAAQKTSGSGVILAGNRVLTNWHVVEFASQVFVQTNQSTDKHVAVVEAGSPDMDLAVVRLEDEAVLAEFPALPMADALPAIRATVNVYGYPVGGDDLSVTEGIVSRIEFSRYNFEATGVRIQVDAALNPGNSGGPAVIDGQLVGVVFSKMNQAENIGYLIPSEEIQAFLADVADGNYDGKPMIFDQLQSTENEALRARLGMPDDLGGVLVRQTLPPSAVEYPLQTWDVITHIGDEPLDKQGNVQLRDDLRLDFRYLVPARTVDNTVPLRILRNGETLDVRVPVATQREFVLPMLRGQYPDHFIYGPLAFTTATQEFVASLGVKGYVYLTAADSPLIPRRIDPPAFPGERMVVMANRMFPHRIVKGYTNMAFGVVDTLNDEPVKNLPHLVEMLRDCQDEFITIRFHGQHETLVFRRDDLESSSEDILADEGIRYQVSDDLRTVWEGNTSE